MIDTALSLLTGGSWARLFVTVMVGFAAGGWAAWQTQNWRAAHAELKRMEAAQAQHALNEKRSYNASDSYQKESANVRTEYRTRTRIVRQIVDRPVYRNVCLDDAGLREVNDAIAGVAPAP